MGAGTGTNETASGFLNAEIISGPYKGKTIGEAIREGMKIPMESKSKPRRK